MADGVDSSKVEKTSLNENKEEENASINEQPSLQQRYGLKMNVYVVLSKVSSFIAHHCCEE